MSPIQVELNEICSQSSFPELRDWKMAPEMCCTEHNDVTVELTFELWDIKCHHFITFMNSWGRTKNVFHASQWTWPLTFECQDLVGACGPKERVRWKAVGDACARISAQGSRLLCEFGCFAGGWDLDVYCRRVVCEAKVICLYFQQHIVLKLNNTFLL